MGLGILRLVWTLPFHPTLKDGNVGNGKVIFIRYILRGIFFLTVPQTVFGHREKYSSKFYYFLQLWSVCSSSFSSFLLFPHQAEKRTWILLFKWKVLLIYCYVHGEMCGWKKYIVYIRCPKVRKMYIHTLNNYKMVFIKRHFIFKIELLAVNAFWETPCI